MFMTHAKSEIRKMAWMPLVATGWLASTAFAQPNLEVRINNVIQTPNQVYTFPSTDVGASTPVIVVMRNIGSEPLFFPSSSPISITGGYESQFSIVQPPLESNNQLSPNGSTAFRIDFMPTIPKAVMSAVVNIPTNDPDTPIFNLRIDGVVPVPQMAVTYNGQTISPGLQVNLPPAPVGSESEIVITIHNMGERTLLLTEPVDKFGGFRSTSFSITQPETDEIAPGESVDFAVRFAPDQTGTASTNIGISSNDLGNFPNGRMTFVVRGVGLPGPEATEDVDTTQDEPVNEDTEEALDAVEDVESEPDGAAETPDDEFSDPIFPQASFCGLGIPFAMIGCLVSMPRKRFAHR